VLLIGCPAKDICFNQSEALPSQIWVVTRHQYGMFAVDPHMLFRGKTRGGVAKCRLFCQVILNGVRLRVRGRLPYIHGCVDEGLLSLVRLCSLTRPPCVINGFFRYWSGLIRLCVRTGLRQEALKLVVSLSDMKVIKNPQSWGR